MLTVRTGRFRLQSYKSIPDSGGIVKACQQFSSILTNYFSAGMIFATNCRIAAPSSFVRPSTPSQSAFSLPSDVMTAVSSSAIYRASSTTSPTSTVPLQSVSPASLFAAGISAVVVVITAVVVVVTASVDVVVTVVVSAVVVVVSAAIG